MLELCPVTTTPPRVPGWAYVARRLMSALCSHGYPVTPGAGDEPRAKDEFACALMIAAGCAGRVIAAHPGARVRGIDVFQHEDYGPDHVGFIVELDTHHLFGGSLPVLHGELTGHTATTLPDMAALLEGTTS